MPPGEPGPANVAFKGRLRSARSVHGYGAQVLVERRLREDRVDARDAPHLAREGEHDVDGGRLDVDEAAHLLDDAEQGVELDRAALVEVLEHRGAVRADAGRPVALDPDGQAGAAYAAIAANLMASLAASPERPFPAIVFE